MIGGNVRTSIRIFHYQDLQVILERFGLEVYEIISNLNSLFSTIKHFYTILLPSTS